MCTTQYCFYVIEFVSYCLHTLCPFSTKHRPSLPHVPSYSSTYDTVINKFQEFARISLKSLLFPGRIMAKFIRSSKIGMIV